MAAHILVLDDTPELLELFEELLTEAGYNVTCLAHSVNDLEEITHLHPDLLLLDYTLGREPDGHLLQRLEHHPETARLPVLVCSAVSSRDVAGITALLGDQRGEFLAKPFHIDDLLTTVQRLLRLRAS